LRRINVPLFSSARCAAIAKVRAWPTWSKPVGEGARRQR
jgi:hypothetical protein